MGYIAVDLDGTLAVSHPGENYDGITIGEPIPKMVARVRAWLQEGKEVRILTARVSGSSLACNDKTENQVRLAIQGWCREHIGAFLKITCEKDYHMEVLYDDRAVQVERNTGELTTDVVRKEANRSAVDALFVLPSSN
jgi:hypothetical protein